MSVQINGLDFLLQGLEKIADEKTVEMALGKACALVEAEAKKKAPKDSGALRRSIEFEVESTEGKVFSNLEYAPYVEFGTGLFAEKVGRNDVPWTYKTDKGEFYKTSGQVPHPFLRPAVYENTQKIVKILKEGMTK